MTGGINSKRMRAALAAELPAEEFDAHQVEYFAKLFDDGAEADAESFVESCSPHLAQLCSSQDEAERVCQRIFQKLRDTAEGDKAASDSLQAKPTAAPAAANNGGALPAEILTWMKAEKLAAYLDGAKQWCNKEGVSTVAEIVARADDFADALDLKKLERKRVQKANTRAAPVVVRPPVQSWGFGPADNPRKYTAFEQLGSGLTAQVYRCTNAEGQVFAAKKMSMARWRLHPGAQRMQQDMKREISLLLLFRHHRILSLHDTVEVFNNQGALDNLYLIMDLMDGGDLYSKIVQLKAFTEPLAKDVFVQIVEGVSYIHSKKIIYRDLKPENILVDGRTCRPDRMEIKLSDFGQSKIVDDEYTLAHSKVGTPQYWAPEVSGVVPRPPEGYDTRVDLWSLGVVLFVMLVGGYPFDHNNDDHIREARINFRPSQLDSKHMSVDAKDLICSLVKVDREQRLSLDGCLNHRWVGEYSRLLKLETELNPRVIEERIPLPAVPTPQQKSRLNEELLSWTTKYRCHSRVANNEVIAKLDETHIQPEMRDVAKVALRQIVDGIFPQQNPQAASAAAG